MRPASPALHVQLLRREAARFAADIWRALGDDLALSVVPPLEHTPGLRVDSLEPAGEQSALRGGVELEPAGGAGGARAVVESGERGSDLVGVRHAGSITRLDAKRKGGKDPLSIGLKNAQYLREGMRPSSLENARRELAAGKTYPVKVTVEPGAVHLTDGRHRLQAAIEAGRSHISAEVRTFDATGREVSKVVRDVPIHGPTPGVSPKTEARLRALLPHEEAERVIAAEAARVRIKRKLDELSAGAGHVDAAVRDQALRVASNNLREFRRVFDLNRKGAVQNIEIRGIQPGIAPAIDAFQRNNAALITRMNENTRDQVREKIDAAWTEGKRVEEIRDEIQERIDVSKSRAELIARDQVLKLNGQITRTRQQSAGVRFYIWTTAGDERVRGSPQAPKSKRDHYHLDGTTQSWDAPPVVAEDGTTAHPGEDYQCRCIAFPVLDENGTEGAGDPGDGGEAD